MSDPSVQREAGWGADASDIGAKPLPLPLTVQQQQLQLARKQQLVQAMLAQQLQDKGGTQMAGNVAIRKSPFEALSQALSAGMLANKQKELDARGQKIGEDYNALGQQEMQKYLDTANGTPGDPRTLLPEGMSGPQDLGTPGDPKRALTEGLMAQHADVRAAMVAKQKQQDAMQKMLGEKAAGAGSNASIVKAAQGGGVSALQPKAPEQKEIAGVIFDTETGKPIEPLGPAGQFQPSYDKNGNLMQTQPQTGKLDQVDKASKIHVQNNANIAGPKAGAEALWKGVETDLGERRKALGGGQALLGTLKDMEQLDKNGMYGGTGADVIGTIAKAGQLVGVPIDKETLANSTAYRSAQTRIWQNLVSQMGGNKGVTKEEAEEIKQIIPRINDDPAGRQRIIQILRNSHARSVQEYGRMADAAKRSYQHDDPTIYHEDLGRLYTTDGSQQQPTPMPTASTQPMSAADYLKKHGAR